MEKNVNKYSARQLAVLSLCRLEAAGKYGSLEADAAITKFKLEGAEKSLYTRLFYGVLERKITLDYIISLSSDKAIDSMTPQMRNILRVSVYQLFYLDRIPEYSIVNEGVELAKKYERLSAAGFVNAVLRKIIKDGMPDINRGMGIIKYLSLKYSVNERICEIYVDELGEEQAEKMLLSMLTHRYLTLRVNTMKISVDGLIGLLSENGIRAEKLGMSPFGVRLLQDVDIQTLLSVIGGLAFVEDGASQAAVTALDVKPGMTVADVCAAPGGKTVSAAICMNDTGAIYAFDLHKNKLRLIEKTAARCGISIIKAKEHDSRETIQELVGACDRVICDVPCSGLGVLSEKPDMRYKELGDVERLIQTQRSILSVSASYLKKGGIMIYSTCTVTAAENQNNVHDFLNENPGYELCYEKNFYPHTDGSNGFYIAKLLRK